MDFGTTLSQVMGGTSQEQTQNETGQTKYEYCNKLWIDDFWLVIFKLYIYLYGFLDDE